MENYHTLIIALLAGLITLEVLLSAKNNYANFRVPDSAASISIGLINLVVNLLFKGCSYLIFTFFYDHSWFKIEAGWLSWTALFFIGDLLSYCFHALGHTSRFFWLAHSVHHSSEMCNLTTAIRTPTMNFFYRFMFWLPLCLIGFPPFMLFITESVIFLYQFFLHTELVGKLGWLEYIFNTPSHHRVHHGTNEKYLDKNFGGMLIIWDRLFGTFQLEEEKALYGLVNKKVGHNPLKIIFEGWIELFYDLGKARGRKDIFRVLFASPANATTPSRRKFSIIGPPPPKPSSNSLNKRDESFK